MPGAADDGREDGAGSVVAGKAGLAHAGAVVHNEGCHIVVAHLAVLGWGGRAGRIGEICRENKERRRQAQSPVSTHLPTLRGRTEVEDSRLKPPPTAGATHQPPNLGKPPAR